MIKFYASDSLNEAFKRLMADLVFGERPRCILDVPFIDAATAKDDGIVSRALFEIMKPLLPR